ncbi:phosphoglycerate mutase-like protein [Fomitopsis serialis]|uniref:phosphoglycerate mutase-like protein n=1 Tax=Fomitopsis serialis TaxID=139415 RepID=UPI0020088AF4|nr:phosphoglycerate mutase-like protein [Neoantrodia serialis]KAH9936664.1 phosphoglycerate mutase-like protein [Neoantrodia serialis]
MSSRKFSIVSGFFLQDDQVHATPATIGALPPRFGLVDDSPECWSKFKSRIAELNDNASSGTTYKVFFLGRHGQGWHNVAEAKYGTRAWDDYYSKLYGDSEMTWGPDPLLTALGVQQAETARTAWLKEIPNGMPTPQRCFASPLHRALSTWQITFASDESFPQVMRKVMILENLREEHGVHTCDMRDSRSLIERNFPPPTYGFELGFTEEDAVWQADVRETKDHIKGRAQSVLDRIFDDTEETYISITAHGGIINGILAAVGRPSYSLPTGGVLPLVIRGDDV